MKWKYLSSRTMYRVEALLSSAWIYASFWRGIALAFSRVALDRVFERFDARKKMVLAIAALLLPASALMQTATVIELAGKVERPAAISSVAESSSLTAHLFPGVQLIAIFPAYAASAKESSPAPISQRSTADSTRQHPAGDCFRFRKRCSFGSALWNLLTGDRSAPFRLYWRSWRIAEFEPRLVRAGHGWTQRGNV